MLADNKGVGFDGKPYTWTADAADQNKVDVSCAALHRPACPLTPHPSPPLPASSSVKPCSKPALGRIWTWFLSLTLRQCTNRQPPLLCHPSSPADCVQPAAQGWEDAVDAGWQGRRRPHPGELHAVETQEGALACEPAGGAPGGCTCLCLSCAPGARLAPSRKTGSYLTEPPLPLRFLIPPHALAHRAASRCTLCRGPTVLWSSPSWTQPPTT